MDKTGTITEGKPKLVEKAVLASQQPEAVVLEWAADLAGHSDHPVSKAIAQGLDAGEGGVSGFKALAGRGVEAQLQGQTLVLGNHRLIEERGLCSPALEELLASHGAKGRTVTLLADEREVLAIFAVADTIKDSSREAIGQLHELGVASVMLIGDNVSTAQAIAEQGASTRRKGICCPRTSCLPSRKCWLNTVPPR